MSSIDALITRITVNDACAREARASLAGLEKRLRAASDAAYNAAFDDTISPALASAAWDAWQRAEDALESAYAAIEDAESDSREAHALLEQATVGW